MWHTKKSCWVSTYVALFLLRFSTCALRIVNTWYALAPPLLPSSSGFVVERSLALCWLCNAITLPVVDFGDSLYSESERGVGGRVTYLFCTGLFRFCEKCDLSAERTFPGLPWFTREFWLFKICSYHIYQYRTTGEYLDILRHVPEKQILLLQVHLSHSRCWQRTLNPQVCSHT